MTTETVPLAPKSLDSIIAAQAAEIEELQAEVDDYRKTALSPSNVLHSLRTGRVSCDVCSAMMRVKGLTRLSSSTVILLIVSNSWRMR